MISFEIDKIAKELGLLEELYSLIEQVNILEKSMLLEKDIDGIDFVRLAYHTDIIAQIDGMQRALKILLNNSNLEDIEHIVEEEIDYLTCHGRNINRDSREVMSRKAGTSYTCLSGIYSSTASGMERVMNVLFNRINQYTDFIEEILYATKKISIDPYTHAFTAMDINMNSSKLNAFTDDHFISKMVDIDKIKILERDGDDKMFQYLLTE